MEWFDDTVNVRYVHPAEIKEGMRIAREVYKPIGRGGAMVPCTELTPVWDISLGDSDVYYGTCYLFRLSSGELRSTRSDHRVPVDPEIIPGNLPPHAGTWITNEPFGFHDHKSFMTDREWYEASRVVEVYEEDDGRVYRLLRGKHGVLKVCRWDQGKKWLGPARISPEAAYDQFDAIKEGRAW
ncbi:MULTISPECIES: hypothetical protein [Streptomyces]|uniref:hypothetical protein n=1 Tax=Streptomyces TaxID=1883 RepID=UPI0004CCEBE1|nr:MULTISPECIES: hypothetical protein [Streptomyces]KOT51147.1 hypothetical protein ADK43_32650 [Streptomyces rimosus subsp. rimosus]